MSILNKVTLKTLRKNPTRTAVTVIGIILSAAMICAVTTFASSFLGYMRDDAVYETGNWHVKAENTVAGVIADSRIKAVSVLQNMGYCRYEGIENEYKPYLFLGAMNSAFEQNMPVHLTEGRLPQNESEVIVPHHLKTNGGVTLSMGQALSLALGQRVFPGESMALWQDMSFDPEMPEELINCQTLTLTVVGFYERPSFEDYTSPGYTLLTYREEPIPGQSLSAYYLLNRPKEAYNFAGDYGLDTGTNWELLAFSGVSRYNGFYTALYSLAAIVIGLIIFGSVSLIYNAFAISVSQRTKQFGLLISIGATKKQIRKSVLFESLAVSAIGIPLGILAGVGGIGVTLYLLRDRIMSMTGMPLPMQVQVSPLSLLIAVVIALVTVLISARIPTKRAAKITAIDAIRLTNDIRVKPKEVRTRRLTRKLFGFEGVLASKYYRRNRKSYRATVLSLFMSIVLFISTSSFCMYITQSAQGPYGSENFDIECLFLTEEAGQEEAITATCRELSAIPGVTEGVVQCRQSCEALLNKDDCTDFFADSAFDGNEEMTSLRQSVRLCFIEDEYYKDLLAKQGLDPALFTDSSAPRALLYDRSSCFDHEEGKYLNTPLLKQNADSVALIRPRPEYRDRYVWDVEYADVTPVRYELYDPKTEEHISLTREEYEYTETVTIGGRVDTAPLGVLSDSFTLMFPLSLCRDILGEQNEYLMFFTARNPGTVSEKMENLVSGFAGEFEIYNYAESMESQRSMIFVIRVFSFGFIALISLIAMANVFNTITTNIGLRRREFAILKSVGMTGKGLNRMMNFECLLYGLRSLLLGIPVSFGVTWLIYKAAASGYMNTYQIPWNAVIIAVCSVFATVFISMLYAMRSIKKDNPIEALKNENL